MRRGLARVPQLLQDGLSILFNVSKVSSEFFGNREHVAFLLCTTVLLSVYHLAFFLPLLDCPGGRSFNRSAAFFLACLEART